MIALQIILLSFCYLILVEVFYYVQCGLGARINNHFFMLIIFTMTQVYISVPITIKNLLI